MAPLEVDSFLHDADLVIHYATSAGILDDEALITEFERVQAARKKGQDIPAKDLVIALNKQIKEISPFISLLDLRTKKSPFDEASLRKRQVIELALSIFSLILVVLVAGFAIDLNNANTHLKIFQEYQDSQPAEKLERLMIFSQAGVQENVKSAEYQEYQKIKQQLDEMVDKARGALSGSQEIAVHSWLPFSSLLTGNFNVQASPPLQLETFPVKAKLAPYITAAESDKQAAYDFALALNLEVSGFSFAVVSQLQNYIYVRSAWVLPGLAGLLGSSVYLMRFLIFNQKSPIVEWYQILIRIVMGGVAGVIVGWFIVAPSAIQTNVAAVTSVPFGLAFLTGFSIDILFSTLDRINKAVVSPEAHVVR
ncbi:hypothetical protein [Caballeronia sp. S22]|uniref:hypothetical protein n=1 Tax=Caballeronia sp. S22 TaxID=3137182 RepID=UPI003530F7B1